VPHVPNLTHECVPNVLKLSSNVNECKPLHPGRCCVSSGLTQTFGAGDFFDINITASAGCGLSKEGRCRLTVSKSVLKAPMISALEATI